MSLEAGFWALRLEVRGGGLEEEKEKEKEKKEKEKVPLCESIGHRSLRGRCPKLKKTDTQLSQSTQSCVAGQGPC